MALVEIKKGDTCPICKEEFLNEDLTAKREFISCDFAKAVHAHCFYPYVNQKHMNLVFQVECYSIGDTISTTPVLREIRRIYPDIRISVHTMHPDVFKYNPHIQEIIDLNFPFMPDPKFHFLVRAFKADKIAHYATHSVEFSSASCFEKIISKKDWEYEVNYSEDDLIEAKNIISKNGINPLVDKLILVHPHKTEWPTRDWGTVHMKELCSKLEQLKDFKIVSIGGKRESVPTQIMKNYVEIPNVIDLYGKLTFLQSIALMDMDITKLIITPDTGTLHMAACTKNTPIVGIFTLIKPEFRTPVRNGVFSHNFYPVSVSEKCNCTYDALVLENEVYFGTCPKKAFLERTRDCKIPFEYKKDGLNKWGFKKEWNKENIEYQINESLNPFVKPNLPCFPSVNMVFESAISALRSQGHETRF